MCLPLQNWTQKLRHIGNSRGKKEVRYEYLFHLLTSIFGSLKFSSLCVYFQNLRLILATGHGQQSTSLNWPNDCDWNPPCYETAAAGAARRNEECKKSRK